ncbi:hypothetical protein SESBI_24169 [Sesbania bispinosa]|nr:hypothetical protein SESBI_24169 [Sesbania bispinosa]
MATICNIEPIDSPSQPTEPEPEGNAQAPETTQPQSTEVPPPQAGSPEEPQKDTPPPDETHAENNQQQSPKTPRMKDVGEVHGIYHNHNLPNYRNRYGSGSGHNYFGDWDRYHNSSVFLEEPPQPVYVTHSYNTYRPSPYVIEYEYVRSPPPRHTHYNRNMEHYGGDYQNGNGNITSMFSDENPNACRIV